MGHLVDQPSHGATRILGNRQDAEDAVQEVILRADPDLDVPGKLAGDKQLADRVCDEITLALALPGLSDRQFQCFVRRGWLSGVSIEAAGVVVGAGLLAAIAALWTFLT